MPYNAYTCGSMTLRTLRASLLPHPSKNLRFVMPEGDPIPADFHLTEVGHVVKNFVDCGGTRRRTETVVLQAWVAANESDHRLTAGKLASILDLAKSVVPSDELDVEVEYEGCVISQYPVTRVDANGDELRFTLAKKHTDCLAREACGLEPGGCSPVKSSAAGKCC